ncbi:MAG: ketopantoate reductase family protein [Acidobacteria bacterium]|nr:ketopantoate reductase family protein [Acidobacteriota bacterium]
MTARKRDITNPDAKVPPIVIFGAGAMACLFAARLAGVSKVILVDAWAEAIAAIRERGIQYEDVQGRRVIKVQAELLGTPLDPVGLAFVLVKSWQTESISEFLPRYLNPGGCVISLQNGLGNIEKLGANACPGSTAEGATLLGPGHVTAGGSGPTHIVAPGWVVDLLRSAGFDSYGCSESEAQSLLWGKLSVSCGINALTALLRIRNGDLLQRPAAAGLMVRAAMECAAVARASGIELPFTDAGCQVKQVAERTAQNKSSMLQDILRGAPTECDAINGAVVVEGSRAGVPTPVNEVLWRLVKAAAHSDRSGF